LSSAIVQQRDIFLALYNSTKFVNYQFRLAIKVLMKYTICTKMKAYIPDFNL
jgi:hypothetical protein